MLYIIKSHAKVSPIGDTPKSLTNIAKAESRRESQEHEAVSALTPRALQIRNPINLLLGNALTKRTFCGLDK